MRRAYALGVFIAGVHALLAPAPAPSRTMTRPGRMTTRRPATEAQPRALGGMETLFAPRCSLDTITLPPVIHAVAAVLDAPISEANLRAGLERAVGTHAMLSRRIIGDGVSAERGPLGAPLDFPVVRNVLAPFGDDNMRLGESTFAFAPVPGATAETIVAAAIEPDVASWEQAFEAALAGTGAFGAAFDLEKGPLWRCARQADGKALVFAFDHAISDQPSAMALIRDVLDAGFQGSGADPAALDTPPSLEDEILGADGRSRGFSGSFDFLNMMYPEYGRGLLGFDKGSLGYMISKLTEPSTTPLAASPHLPDNRWGDESMAASKRAPALVFRTLDASALAALRTNAKAEGTTIGSALAAAAARAFASLCPEPIEKCSVLQSLDMRRFAKQPVTKELLACHAGSMDLFLEPAEEFWATARAAGAGLATFVDSGFGEQSVRVFDWACDAMEMTRLVELNADNPFTLGRAYCCGTSNTGLYPADDSVAAMYYGTSTLRAGATFQASCVTVRGDLNVCVNVATPIARAEDAEAFADRFIAELAAAAAGQPRPPAPRPEK